MKSHVSEGGEVRWPTRVNALQTQERHKKKNVEIIETKKQQKCTNAKIKYHSTQNSKQLQERNPICFGVFFWCAFWSIWNVSSSFIKYY